MGVAADKDLPSNREVLQAFATAVTSRGLMGSIEDHLVLQGEVILDDQAASAHIASGAFDSELNWGIQASFPDRRSFTLSIDGSKGYLDGTLSFQTCDGGGSARRFRNIDQLASALSAALDDSAT
jgi:hypothetical protein